MILGVDYSFSRPGGISISQGGYKFVCRYLSNDPSKNLSKTELAELRAHNLEIVLVWEDSANAALGGKAQGIKDATAAAHQATALGITGHPIYFAVDFDATPAQQSAINAYMQGVCDVIGLDRAGIYGGFYVVERVAQAHLAHWFWQTTAWSGGQVYSGVHIYQNGKSDFNGQADIDEARQTNYGQWPYTAPKPPVKTPVVPKPTTPIPVTPKPVTSPTTPVNVTPVTPTTPPTVPINKTNTPKVPKQTPPKKTTTPTLKSNSWWTRLTNWLKELV